MEKTSETTKRRSLTWHLAWAWFWAGAAGINYFFWATFWYGLDDVLAWVDTSPKAEFAIALILISFLGVCAPAFVEETR
jgi:hypothetical protein